MTQALSKAEIEDAFSEIGESLVRKGKVAEIAVYGGADIMLQFQATFRTRDVDVQVESGDHGTLMQAAHEAADRRGWLRSWLSEAVTVDLGEPGGTSLLRAYPSEARAGLRVYVAKPDYLLAMKLRAMRIGTRDEADATMLARATGIVRREDMIALLGRYFPKEPPDARRLAVITQFARCLDGSPTGHAR